MKLAEHEGVVKVVAMHGFVSDPQGFVAVTVQDAGTGGCGAPGNVGLNMQVLLIVHPGGRATALHVGVVPVTAIGMKGGCGTPTMNVGGVMVGGVPQLATPEFQSVGGAQATVAHAGADVGPTPAIPVPATA